MSAIASAPIVASVPGRLRLRDRRLKNPALLEKLEKTLAGLAGFHSLRANAAAGSLVFFYDAGQCGRKEMEAAVARAADAVVAGPQASGAADVPAGASVAGNRRAMLRRANRYSKYVMYASLGVSLALAAGGAKRGHALSGAVFVAALGVHLAVHRKHLLS